MKKLFLFLALSSLFFSSGYSQLNNQSKPNNRIPGISLYQNCDPYYHAKDFDFNSFAIDSVCINNKFIPKIPDVKLFTVRTRFMTPEYTYIQKSIDNMPCLKPVGVFSMPCVKPIGVFPMPCVMPVGVSSSIERNQREPLDEYPLLMTN